MTSLEPAVTQGPLGRTSMPCGSRVNGIAAGLLIKHTGGAHYTTHSHIRTAAANPAYSATHSETHPHKEPIQPSSLKGDGHKRKTHTHTDTH